jgi:serine protease AprX
MIRILFVLGILALTSIVFAPVPRGIEANSRTSETITLDPITESLGVRKISDVYDTANALSGINEFGFFGSTTKGFSWSSSSPDGRELDLFAISLDGETLTKVAVADRLVRLRFAEFDPLENVPPPPDGFAADAAGQEKAAYIIQFETQPLEEFRVELRSVGAEIFTFLPSNSYIVQIDAAAAKILAAKPYVRWVGRYQPAYKLDEELLSGLVNDTLQPERFNVTLLGRGPLMQGRIAGEIIAMGGTVQAAIPEGFRIEATLTPEQLRMVAKNEDVLFIDRWAARETDMDLVRSTGGANFMESTAGFTGVGVRAEVMDNGLRQTHNDFQSGLAPLIHNSSNTDEPTNHGTSTYGIMFGRGTSNAAAKGMLPNAQGIFADFSFLGNRYTHTARLNEVPYQAVLQSNSWGSGLTVNYNSYSAELDDILSLSDILILHSQSNDGSRYSRPEAWAKNVVSVGGIVHSNTASFSDDRWSNGASIGPAADGRIKPDLSHFYDAVHTTHNSGNSGYTSSFGGTSAATPITAGHFGIFYEMWHNGMFRNATGSTVFESRPKPTTAKAVMINSAIQWDMTIPSTDITRERQGFGRANVENLYSLRNKMLVINEESPITNLETQNRYVTVPNGSQDPLKATLVFSDPKGVVSASQARINDLTLRVTSPSGTVYWGNNGLGNGGGTWSTPGGSANSIDTVENVFIPNPEPGIWTVSVIASEINQDARIESPAVDADYALVVSGVSVLAPTAANVSVSGRVLDPYRVGIRGAVVTITDSSGTELRTQSNNFGNFTIRDVPAGRSYVVSASHRKFIFDPASVAISVEDDVAGLEFRSAQ